MTDRRSPTKRRRPAPSPPVETRQRPGPAPKERPQAPDLPDLGPVLAARVSQARAERERATETAISLRDLAAASGLSLTALQTVLAGRVAPRLSTLQGLAAALRVRVGWLLGE